MLRLPWSPRRPDTQKPSLSLALQGGGAHGAYTWGVLDRLLEAGIRIDGISGTSAGAMNAVALAHGWTAGGADGARAALADFWQAVGDSVPFHVELLNSLNSTTDGALPTPMNVMMGFMRLFSPYQLNPFELNPLRDVVRAQFDFERLRRDCPLKLFIAATTVRTGKVRLFHTAELSEAALLASACLPTLFQAVRIGDEHYWDGGYVGNPAIYPLIYETATADVMVVHINPLDVAELPRTAGDIMDRINEISFNSSLIKELRAVHFVQKLMEQGWIKDEYIGQLRYILMHSLRSDDVLADLPVNSKMRSDWEFLTMLRDRGRAAAAHWLTVNYDKVGVRSSVDLTAQFL